MTNTKQVSTMKKIRILKSAIISLFILTLTLTQAPAQAGFDTPPNGFFYIKSVQAGNQNAGYWDQPGNNAPFKRGANIMAWAKDNGRDQRFRFVSAGGGFYHIVSQNGGYVDVAGSRNANGTNILIWTRKTSNNSNQKFRFRHIGNGRWKIYTAWGRIICLAGRKHNNGSNIHTWADHKGASTEWYFKSVSNGRIYIPEPAISGIQGKLEAYNYDSSGRKIKVNPGKSDIGVWVYNPSAPKDKYIKKKTVKTDPSGNFNLGTEFDNESAIFIMSENDERSSAYTVVTPKSGAAGIKNFVSEKYDSDNYALVDTFHRGKQYYHLDNGYFYLKSGIVTRRDNFFFPRLTSISGTNPSSAKLLSEIKAGAAAQNDNEIAAKMENVFQFLRTKTKNSMGTNDKTITDAANALFANCRTSPNHPLTRWPTFDEYAATYSRFGFIPTGNCTAWSHLTATLLYAAGIPSDKFFVAKFNYDMSWIVEHWVIAINVGGRWYSIDPQHNRALRFNSLADFNSPVLNRDGGAYDYKKPFEAVLLPGSSINRVPYLGDPADMHKIVAERKAPKFFMENSSFEYSSGTLVGHSKGNARVKSVEGNEVTIEIDTVSTSEGPRGMETRRRKFDMVLTHKGDGLYTSGTDYVYNGKVDSSGKRLSMSGEQSGFTLKASDPEIDPSFMTFFSTFKEKWQKGDKGSTSGDIVFPLTLETSFEGSSREKKLTAASFFNEVTIEEPIMYPLRYEVDGENVILVHYGYEAQFFTLYFNRTRGNWKLVKVKKSQD